MKRMLLAIAIAVLAAPLAHAGHMGMGGFGGHGGGRHGGGDGLVGFGGWGYDTERVQTRFENQFEDLQADYDAGLADIDDFYNSDEYTEIVDGTEWLVDRYDLFLTGVERSLAHLDDYLAIVNDDLVFYQDLLAEYQARDDLSEERLERIEERLTNIQDHLTDKIDFLTEKQTTLTENFGSYETFSTDLSTYLAEIIAAGGGTTDTEETTAAVIASAVALSAIADTAPLAAGMGLCELPTSALAATTVPEPASKVLCAVALAGALSLRRRPRERRQR